MQSHPAARFSASHLSHAMVHFSIIMQQAEDAGDTEIMSKAILHIWISPHQVQIVNLYMKMQFAPSKVYIFISRKKKTKKPQNKTKKQPTFIDSASR